MDRLRVESVHIFNRIKIKCSDNMLLYSILYFIVCHETSLNYLYKRRNWSVVYIEIRMVDYLYKLDVLRNTLHPFPSSTLYLPLWFLHTGPLTLFHLLNKIGFPISFPIRIEKEQIKERNNGFLTTNPLLSTIECLNTDSVWKESIIHNTRLPLY